MSAPVATHPRVGVLLVPLAALALLLTLAPAATHAVSFHSTAIDITPDGLEVWVVNPDHGTVGVIATDGAMSNQLIAEVSVGGEPWCVDLHPTNGEAWVTSMADNHVYIVDVASRAVIDSIPAGFETFGVAFNPSGTTALVTATGSDEIFVVDVATRTVTRNLADTNTIYRRPRGIAWQPDGEEAFVTHLLMPEFFGRVSNVFTSTWTVAQIFISQTFGQNFGGYPSTTQNLTLAPDGVTLWLPNSMLHTSNGQLFGNPITPTNITHAMIAPIDVVTSSHLTAFNYAMSDSNGNATPSRTPVGGPIAVDFKSQKAYVVNLHSENVTVLDDDIRNNPTEIAVLPVGKGPIGIVTHPSRARAYVANWLSRDVTVLSTFLQSVVATVPSTSTEVLPPQILNGKQLFFTSTGAMSLDGRVACASCHVFGTHDARPWDLSQFGKHIRATPDIRGIGFTGAHDWTSDKDEMQDHDFGILEFAGGAGLIPAPNPPLGTPNAGLSADMDDIGRFMASLTHRTTTPFRNPDGSMTAMALGGEGIFNDPTVACATCHVPPFYTDSVHLTPFVKHDVGTADSSDADAAAGFDTPSLVGVWDRAPYLHDRANSGTVTLRDVVTTKNPNDLHGTTSQLTSAQVDSLVAFLQQIAWPGSTGTAVSAPTVRAGVGGSLESVYPNPFGANTSLRFSLERSPSRVEIGVFDVRGRRVRTLFDRPLARGTHVVGWDSRDDAGRRVSPGVYFARLAVNGEERGGKKMTVVH